MKEVVVCRHVPHEGLGAIADALEQVGLSWKEINLYEPAAPTFGAGTAAGLVVMGGPMNVDETDRYPFLADEVRWIQSAIERQLPVLGVCLGAQLIAKALGAKVYKNRIKEIGWYPLQLTEAGRGDPLFRHFAPTEVVFQWHGDTFDLPSGAAHLARSAGCAHQAFRYRDNVYAFQYHIEVTAAMIEEWLTQPDNVCEVQSLPYISPEAIRRDTPRCLPRLTELARQTFAKFAAMCYAIAKG